MEKKIIKFGILTILFITFVIIFLNILYITVIEPEGITFREENDWQKFKTENLSDLHLDYAFFGDSHTQFGIQASLIPNAYNFAHSGDDYIETYYKVLYRLKNDNLNINTAILPLDPHSFVNDLPYEQRIFQDIRYSKKITSLKNIANLTKKSMISLLISNYFPVFGEGEKFIQFFLIFEKQTLIQGWAPHPGNFSNMNQEIYSKQRIEVYYPENSELIDPISFEYYLKTLNLLKEHNVSIILITYPHTNIYNTALINKNIDKDALIYLLLNMTEQGVGKSFTYHSYYDIYANNTDMFKDFDHLNPTGASEFTTLLTKEI